MISSADNKPIVGVSVYVEGTTVGATSDINGNYTLKVPAGTKHVTFAFLGYDTKKIAVADVELFKLVTLIEASNVMDDVVVVAFGTQKKESLVGAVQVVRPSTLKVTSSNLFDLVRGQDRRRHLDPVVGRTRRRRCEFLDSRHLDLRG